MIDDAKTPLSDAPDATAESAHAPEAGAPKSEDTKKANGDSEGRIAPIPRRLSKKL
jgi:hypothetical protein